MQIEEKPLHNIIEEIERGVGNAAALTFLWIVSKHPTGVTSKQLARGRGVTTSRASRWLSDLKEDQFLFESGRKNRSIVYEINWERL